ncbi:MAG: hypothetical protein HND55_09050 [Pseudomonadota bacterium]|nr:MAG: hypothetical protein HND55_09050 [Pseudomonadota bacterium]
MHCMRNGRLAANQRYPVIAWMARRWRSNSSPADCTARARILLITIIGGLVSAAIAGDDLDEVFQDRFEHIPPVALQLLPASGVDGAQRVSFALPLPPGALFDTNRASLWLDGLEQPLHVEALGTWHALPPPGLHCTDTQPSDQGSLRSVLLQADIDFGAGQAVVAEVRLDRTRSLTLADPVPVEQTWQLAESGSYVAEDGVLEPKVLAQWSPQHLRCAGLAPALGKVGLRTYMAATDQAQIDFFYTTINDFGPSGWPASQGLIDYKNDYEPWLYDRPAVFYLGHLRSGNIDQLREAHRAAHFYAQNIYTPEQCQAAGNNNDCVGYFRLKNPDIGSSWKDPKYSYGEGMELAWWMTGLPIFRDTAQHVVEAADRGAPILQADTAGDHWFSERWWGFALQANASAFAITGDSAVHDKLVEATAAFRTRQLSHPQANGGCFIYNWDGGSDKGFSPWMSALLQYAFLNTWQLTADARLPDMMSDLAGCISDLGLRTVSGEGPQIDGQFVSYYGVRHDGTPLDSNPWSGIEHSSDVASLLAIGSAFAAEPLREQLRQHVHALIPSHEWTIDYWTRNTPDYPRYRVSPPRKYAWQYHYVHVIPYLVND